MDAKILNLTKMIEKRGRHRKYWKNIFTTLAVIVVFCTTYALILPAITKTRDVFCGQEAHKHEAACYTDVLICDIDESPEEGLDEEYHVHEEDCYSETTNLICPITSQEGHTHAEECKQVERVRICNLEENEEHIHEDACYENREILICDQEEEEPHVHEELCYETVHYVSCEKEEIMPIEKHLHSEQCYEKKMVCEIAEHEHILQCYSDKTADIETEKDWEKNLPEELTGIWSEDLLAVAKTQLGYHESTANYQVVKDDETKGYTRYGDWYGDKYGDWCAMFVSFCLYYADIPESAIGYEANCQKWVEELQEKEVVQNMQQVTEKLYQYRAADTYIPKQGDLIFFEVSEEDRANHIGIVTEVRLAEEKEDGEGKESVDSQEEHISEVDTIEGNSSDAVRERTYRLNDEQILGYGVLPENPDYREENTGENSEVIVEEIATEVPEEPKDEAAVLEEILITRQTITAVIYADETLQQIAENDKTIITISGLLPEKVSAKAYPVILENEVVDGKNLVFAYDITLYDKDGNLIENHTTDYPITVTIEPEEWRDGNQEREPEDYQIYYIPEEGEPEPMDTTGEENAVSFQTEHFSTYALTVSGSQNTIYLNGASGDDNRAGTSANTAVKTFEKAAALVKQGGTIYISGTVTINSDMELDVNNEVTIRRYSSFTGPLMTVVDGGNLTLSNVTIHGGSGTPAYSDSSPTIATNSSYASNSAKAPLIVVNKGGRLTVSDGTVLQYNSNKPDSSSNKFVENGYVGLGGAVY